MVINIVTEGLLDPKELQAWFPETQKAIYKAVADGMKTSAPDITNDLQAKIRQSFDVKFSGFVKSFRAKIYDKDKTRNPIMEVGSRIAWSGVHEPPEDVITPRSSKYLFVPFKGMKFKNVKIAGRRTAGRVGKRGLKGLGTTDIIPIKGRRAKFLVIQGGMKGKRFTVQPIGVLIPSVRLRPRFELEPIVGRAVPGIAGNIQKKLDLLSK